jgi:serine/threonine-protein kinase
VNRAGILENAGDYEATIKALDAAIALLDEDHVETENQVRRRIERSQARTFGLVGRHEEAWRILSDLRQRCRRIEGEDSGEYAMITWQLALLAGRMKDPARGLPLLDEAERLWSALVPPAHQVFAHILRVRAGFAIARGDYAGAEHARRAIAAFRPCLSAVDLTLRAANWRASLANSGRRKPEIARLAAGIARPCCRRKSRGVPNDGNRVGFKATRTWFLR